ncbi:MAG: LAGLIDADG family homing endonuclease [Patescibacteria group bacterium]
MKITKKELKSLYLNRKLSSPAIGKIYNLTPEYIRSLLRKYKIPIRTKSEAIKLLYNINIPKKILKNLYLNKKLSSPNIAKKFNCSPALIRKRLREHNIPIRPLYEALPLSNKSPYFQKDFSGNPEEKAYLIGLRLGDLNVRSESKNSSTIFVHTNSTKSEFIQLIEDLFLPYGHIWKSKPAKNKAICIRCSLNRSFDFLLAKKDLIEPWILKNKNYFAAFLSGYIDAEGTFCLCGGNVVFSIKTQDKNILHQIREKLINLGILLRPPLLVRKEGSKDRRGVKSNKDIYGIWIHRKDAIIKLIDLISPYLKHKDKLRRVKILQNNIIERNKKYNNRKDNRFYKLYSKEGIKI